MRFALQWAEKRGLVVVGFDSPIDTKKEGKTKEDEQQVIARQVAVLKEVDDWKLFNKKEYLRRITDHDLLDPQKYLSRNKEMLCNIEQQLPEEGIVVIITGAGHLDFFEGHLPNGRLILRN